MKLTQEQKSLIEKMGVFQEHSGMPPTESRILALLLVADETEMTFEEIKDHLQISKSATSNSINLLLKTNKLEYITKSGDRKRYFRTKISSWEQDAESNLQGMLSVNGILKEILNQRTTKTPKFNSDLKNVIDFIDFLQVELLNIFKKWKKER